MSLISLLKSAMHVAVSCCP